MSATVHRLFPGGGKQPPPSSDDRPNVRMTSHPLIEALRAECAPVLLGQLQTMFDGADDALFGISQRAGASDDPRSAFDTMRLLRLERKRIATEFERAFAGSFQVAADSLVEEFDLDRLSVMPTEELEEKIALGNLVTKADNLHKDLLRDIGQRITYMIRDLGIPVARQALTPAVICNAFKASIATLDLPLSVRLLLYKLFDRVCTSSLDEVYRPALRLLDRHNIRPPAPEARAAEPSWSPFDAPPAPVEPEEPLTAPVLDHATRVALQGIGGPAGGYLPQDAQFARELLALASIDAGDRVTVGRVAPAQRMSLVGQMCNEILSDPHLPATMRPLFERLRFPLIKIALADGSFFRNRVHPVRRLVAEAAETAAASRVANHAVVRRLEERLRHIAEQIDLSATFVRPQLSQLQALSMPEIASFLDQQREESETRRENVLNKVRRTVAQELEVHTLGRKPGAPLVNFLRVGWGPLMAARLLRHGMNSRMWIEAINRLVQILASLDVQEIEAQDRAAREDIYAAVTIDLGEIGMRPEKTEAAVGHLRRAYADLDEHLATLDPNALPPPDFELLTPTETAAVLAEFPPPASQAGATPEARREPRRAPPARASAAAPEQKPDASPAPPSPVPGAAADVERPAAVAAAPIGSVPEKDTADATDTELLKRCLTAESWFRVYDASNGQTLWLKVSRYYPEHGSVGFTGFDAKKTLSIRAGRLIEDLVLGRAEPVNASPAQARAMAELRGRHQKKH